MKKILIITNIGKSQIKDTGKYWEIKSIPVTVDDAVMNGVLYPANENALGMPSLVGRPITVTHPKDKEGNNISGQEGEGLSDFFSGGTVTKVYNLNGVNYIDASIKKSILSAQDNSEWFYNALSNKENIGVSTGLTISENNESGESEGGQEYTQVARNQQYDHLAMLEPEEDPAGGYSTFMKFNSSDEGVSINNIGDYMPNPTEKAKSKLFDDIMSLFAAKGDKVYNNDDKGHQAETQLHNEDKPMAENEMYSKEQMKNLRKNMGMKMDGVDDMDHLTMYNEMMDYSKNMGKQHNEADTKDKDTKDKDMMKKNSSETPSYIIELVNKISALESKLTANSESEKSSLVDQVSKLATNALDKEVADHLPIEALKSHLASNGGYLNVNAAGGGYAPKSDSFSLKDMKAPK